MLLAHSRYAFGKGYRHTPPQFFTEERKNPSYPTSALPLQRQRGGNVGARPTRYHLANPHRVATIKPGTSDRRAIIASPYHNSATAQQHNSESLSSRRGSGRRAISTSPIGLLIALARAWIHKPPGAARSLPCTIEHRSNVRRGTLARGYHVALRHGQGAGTRAR